MPHRNGAAVLHATDIKFDQSPGAMNVFCTSDATDLQRSYPVDFQQTANITTFMQKDIINADLGYMVNGAVAALERARKTTTRCILSAPSHALLDGLDTARRAFRVA